MTYAQIQEIYPIPQGTLSYWFKKVGGIRSSERKVKDLEKARSFAAETNRRKKQERLDSAKAQAQASLTNLPLENKDVLKAQLAMLYWAEGSKSDNKPAVFVNSDPKLAFLYITLLRAVFAIDESRFRIELRVHYYHKWRETRQFWSELLQVPESQFARIYVKKRGKRKRFRKNFRGICTIIYSDVQIRRELLSLGELFADKLVLESSCS